MKGKSKQGQEMNVRTERRIENKNSDNERKIKERTEN
jgi:hypothetical protein